MQTNRKTMTAARGLVMISAVIALGWLVSGTPQLAAKERTLKTVHANVVQEFKTVRHLSAQEMTALDRSKLILFDVREDGEFAVSHLKQAIRVDPDITPDAFMKKYANQIAGKTIIVYCSVGVRSSALAERITPLLKRGGSPGVYNLTGGIFGWHNERRPLARGTQSTTYVHPYNRSWGRLLNNRSLISYRPRP